VNLTGIENKIKVLKRKKYPTWFPCN